MNSQKKITAFQRLLAALAASACSFAWAQFPSDIPKDRLQQAKSIGVLSFAADYTRIGVVGTTIFGNEHHYSTLADLSEMEHRHVLGNFQYVAASVKAFLGN